MANIKLTLLQKNTLTFFGKNTFGKNFYWTGGTLLAYAYFQHRYSVDLDFFSDDLFSNEIYLKFINDLKQKIKANKIIETLEHNRRLYLIKLQRESIKLELVYFPFPALEKRKKIKEFSITVDSLTDIMVNKVLSIYQRNEVKDVYDLYCYLTNKPKYNLLRLVKLVEKKFGIALEPVLLIAKINELSTNLEILHPLLLKPEKKLAKKVKFFFQDIFNTLAKKQIK